VANSEATLLVFSDPHVGHKCGLLQDEYHLKGVANTNGQHGNRIEASPIQMPLYKAWCNMIDMGRYNNVVCLGDSIEGPNRKEQGRGVWTTDPGEQAECASDLFSMIKCDNHKFFGVAGSGYHVGADGDGDRAAVTAKGVNGKFDIDLFFKIQGFRIYARHEVGYSSIPHGRSAAVNREMMNAMIQEEMYGQLDIFLFGHTHYTHFVGWEGKLGLIVPCFKYRDSFVRKKGMGGNDLGYSVFYLEDGHYTWNTYDFKIENEIGITEYSLDVDPDEKPHKKQVKLEDLKGKKSKDRVSKR
jgi:predicted phosphodiesterase